MRPKRSDVTSAILERAKDAKDAGINPSSWVQSLFGLSRQQVSRYLGDLCARGLLVKRGVGPGVCYHYVQNKELLARGELALDTIANHPWKLQGSFISKAINVSQPVQLLMQSCLEELIRNAAEHSEGHRLFYEVGVEDETVKISVSDDGMGIFQRVVEQFHSLSRVEAAGDLIKGLQTASSTPGLGLSAILWAADFVTIEANGLRLEIVCRSHDWALVQIAKPRPGSHITVEFDPTSERLQSLHLKRLPRGMTKILIPIVMYCGLASRRLPDRRDAKRMLRHIPAGSHLILDFIRVEKVTLSFLQYILMDFKSAHPSCSLMPVNLNAGIRSMLNLINSSQRPSRSKR